MKFNRKNGETCNKIQEIHPMSLYGGQHLTSPLLGSMAGPEN